MRNGVQLITYADRLGMGGLADVADLLDGPLSGVFTGAHILPFFDPFDGADTGFDPADHTSVDPRLGSWDDVAGLAATQDLTVDLIVNHVSDASPEFLDYKRRGSASRFSGMFLTRSKVFPDGTDVAELGLIHRPRPGKPFTPVEMADGTVRDMWTTFTEHQIDIDVENPAAWDYLGRILDRFAAAGVTQVRLDAVGYAVKKPGTSCFMIPETFELIDRLSDEIHRRAMEVLVEIHGHYSQQIDIATTVDRVYDFALPPLILHSLHTGSSTALRRWLGMSPRNAITVLDTHDGIGVVDVAGHNGNPGLLSDAEVDSLVATVHLATNGESLLATGAAAANLDLYQINSTYFAALGYDEHLYLLARLIQFLSPGIPQVYYAGLLAEPNDMELLARTHVGRDINRPYFTGDAIKEALQRPVVQRLCRLAKFRNRHPAFGGRFTVGEPQPNTLSLRWSNGAEFVDATIAFDEMTFLVTSSGEAGPQTTATWDAIPDS